MISVSIDMSVANDETTAGNRIFGEVYDIQGDVMLCEYHSANYDFDNKKKIAELKQFLARCLQRLKDFDLDLPLQDEIEEYLKNADQTGK